MESLPEKSPSGPSYTKLKPISLKTHPQYTERWLQDIIASDPSVLGLGTLSLKDKERVHPRAGRLDLLLQDDEESRYEVELQLGASDESHIIRTIEYWDQERKRYPQYEHTAVIVAEDITSRFLNVIALFNGSIPIIAIQLTAVETKEGVGLVFTRVLDAVQRGLVDEDEPVYEETSRADWQQKRATPETVELADRIYELCRTFVPGLTQAYKKNYIGFRLNDHPFNFALCKPKTKSLLLEVGLPQTEETDEELKGTDLNVLSYNRHFGLYKLSLGKEDIEKHSDFLKSLLKRAFDARS